MDGVMKGNRRKTMILTRILLKFQRRLRLPRALDHPGWGGFWKFFLLLKGQVGSVQIRSGQVRSGKIQPDQTRLGQVRHYLSEHL